MEPIFKLFKNLYLHILNLKNSPQLHYYLEGFTK